MSDQAAVRAEPDSKGRVLTSLSLAEQVEWLGDSVVDANNPKKAYFKVRMTDGKEGWVNSWQLAAPAQAAVLLEKAPLYKRPDQATATGKSIASTELVAKFTSKDGKDGDWIEVVTMNRAQRGWILRPGFSSDPSELLAATLVRRARAIKDPAKRAAAIQELLNNSSVASSRVYEILKDSLSLPMPVVSEPAPSPVVDSMVAPVVP
ncbi:MAG: hypothetical protein RL318_1310 [Fibrobacterota bacterium]